MMPIPFAALGEHTVVGVVVVGIEHPAGGTILGDAFPAQVGQVSVEWRSLRPVTHDAGLDGDAAGPIRQQPSRRDACRPAAPEGGAPSFPPGSTVQAAGLLGRGQYLRDERLGTTGAALSRMRPSRMRRSSSWVMT